MASRSEREPSKIPSYGYPMTFPDSPTDGRIEPAVDDGYGTSESWAERRIVDLRDAIRREPIKTSLIAMAIGAVLGRIFLR